MPIQEEFTGLEQRQWATHTNTQFKNLPVSDITLEINKI